MNNKKNEFKRFKNLFLDKFDKFKYSFNEYKIRYDLEFFRKKIENKRKQFKINKNELQENLNNKISKLDIDNFSQLKKTFFKKSNLYKRFFRIYYFKKKSFLRSSYEQFLNKSSQKDGSQPDLSLLPPPPVWSRIFIWTLGTGTVTLFLWSVFTKIEETIILTGELSTLTPEIKVSAMDPGEIVSVKVNPNQYVNKGQVLIIYTDDETSARLASTQKKLTLAQEQRFNIYKSYDLKIEQIKDQILRQKDFVEKLNILQKEGAVSLVQLIENEGELNDLEVNLEINKVEKENVLNNNAEEIEELSVALVELEAKTNRFKILSPASGYIQNIKYQSPGERIMSNDVVVTVVPDKELIAKALVPSRVSAPIISGMSAIVEVDAFPSSDFGGINAKVLTISPTVSTNDTSGMNRRTYSAEVKLLEPEIPEKIDLSELRPGMAITTKIKLRDKSIISSAFSILTDIFDPLAEQK